MAYRPILYISSFPTSHRIAFEILTLLSLVPLQVWRPLRSRVRLPLSQFRTPSLRSAPSPVPFTGLWPAKGQTVTLRSVTSWPTLS
jgi:hypothetical protein